MAIVKLDNLTKIYDRAHAPAADDVSLDIATASSWCCWGRRAAARRRRCA